MWKLALTNLSRRWLRSVLTISGVAIAAAVLILTYGVGEAYEKKMTEELKSMGLHLMLVPLGCPYDAAAKVLRGMELETSLPDSVLDEVTALPEVEIAAPLLIAGVPRPDQGRTDMFVGLDQRAIALKRWWKVKEGTEHFSAENDIILGADAAELEMRQIGDPLFSPETGRRFKVAGILERSGTSDDSLFFVPLRTAQEMFNSPNRLTAVAIRLNDPSRISSFTSLLQAIPGAQVVSQTEMMGTFLNMIGSARLLLMCIAGVALCASLAGLLNTLLMSVAERTHELSLLRALGCSRGQLMRLISMESILLTMLGLGAGWIGCEMLGNAIAGSLSTFTPYSLPINFQMNSRVVLLSFFVGLMLALLSSLLPAWRASRVHPALLQKGLE